MHACQKITAQLLSAKSRAGMAGEKLNVTLKLGKKKREGDGVSAHIRFSKLFEGYVKKQKNKKNHKEFN